MGGLAALDAVWAQERVISATVVLGPFVTALYGSLRQTAAVGAVAIAAAAASGAWNHNAGELDWVVRLLVVVAGTGFALLSARSRVVLAEDRRRFRLLGAAASLGDRTTTVDATVRRLGDLLVPALADVSVLEIRRDGAMEAAGVMATGPRAAETEAVLRARSPDARRAATAPRVVERFEDGGDDVLPVAGGRSSIEVPLRARGSVIGRLTLVVTDASGRRYDEDDLAFAELLSGRIALALDNAGLFSELESLEAQQTAALGSLAEAVTIQNARGDLVYANEAAAQALGFASADDLLATPPREIVDAYESFHEDGSPLRLEELPGRRVLAGLEPRPLLLRAVNRATGEERWRVTKASAVLDRDGRPRLAVNVIEDVTEERRAQIAQRFLAEAGAVLAGSLDYEATLTQVARLAVPQLADWCGVTIPDEHGLLRSVAVAHVDPAKVQFAREYNERYPAHASDEGGAARVLRDGVPQVVNAIPDELLEHAVPDPEQRAGLREIGMRAVMIVPMVAASGVIGVISFVTAESARTFTDADLELALELGRRAGIAVENARLYTERTHIARTLQAGLLPDELPSVDGFELSALYRPAGEENVVGGDFYDVFAAGGGWMVVVGDVTGRGAEAASLTAQARYTVRTAASILGDPLRAVQELNRALVGRPDLAIVTVVVVHLVAGPGDGPTTATIVSAGHPPPLLVRDGYVRRLHVKGSMAGAWSDGAFEPATVEMRAGDLLVLHTDGVTDAVGEAGRFGDERLAGVVARATGAAGAVDAIGAALTAFERGPQADDTAVVAVRRLPAA